MLFFLHACTPISCLPASSFPPLWNKCIRKWYKSSIRFTCWSYMRSCIFIDMKVSPYTSACKLQHMLKTMMYYLYPPRPTALLPHTLSTSFSCKDHNVLPAFLKGCYPVFVFTNLTVSLETGQTIHTAEFSVNAETAKQKMQDRTSLPWEKLLHLPALCSLGKRENLKPSFCALIKRGVRKSFTPTS